MSGRTADGRPRGLAWVLYATAVAVLAVGIGEVLTSTAAYGLITFSTGLFLFAAAGWFLAGSRFAYVLVLLASVWTAYLGLSTAEVVSKLVGMVVVVGALASIFVLTTPRLLRWAWRREERAEVRADDELVEIVASP